MSDLSESVGLIFFRESSFGKGLNVRDKRPLRRAAFPTQLRSTRLASHALSFFSDPPFSMQLGLDPFSLLLRATRPAARIIRNVTESLGREIDEPAAHVYCKLAGLTALQHRHGGPD